MSHIANTVRYDTLPNPAIFKKKTEQNNSDVKLEIAVNKNKLVTILQLSFGTHSKE